MECTQRLEFTQELYGSQSEKLCPEQIGFLGICGKKYPVKKGPNKIGRDPQTCNIILNLNSVSRQHAVINILNKKDFMLMDLDSANKTKLSGQILQPYIPQPLHNGDTVQFGEIFGIFRLLEEEDDLPMTQALDIPDTPVPTKHLTRINTVTTIPESPDVSDRDDSFIVLSQPKEQVQCHKTLNFIKPGKTISIQPVGTNKIDNVFWSSSKKSTSLNLDDSNSSLNDSIPPVKLHDEENNVVNDIHELETQQIFPVKKVHHESTDSIYTANTQIPYLENAASIHTADTQVPDSISSPVIHSLNTQIPCEISPSIYTLETQQPSEFGSPSIHNLDTQIPSGFLPKVCKINEQRDMQFNLCANKDIIDIHNAETQVFPAEKENVSVVTHNIDDSPSDIKSDLKLNTPDEEILFDEVDNQSINKKLEVQALLSEDIDLPINKLVESEIDSQSQMIRPQGAKRNMRINSDSSTDCEDIDILPVQKILEKKTDDDVTDCEEELIELKPDKNEKDNAISCKIAENFEDMLTQVIPVDEGLNTNNDVDFENMPTQVLDVIEKDAITEKDKSTLDFEDLPTQVLDEDVLLKEQNDTQHICNEEEISPFKVPLTYLLKAKKKDVSKTLKINPKSIISKTIPSKPDNDRYYQNTQDIYEDLCTQRIDSIEVTTDKPYFKSFNSTENEEPCKELLLDTSISDVDPEEKVNDFVSNLSSQEVRDMIGVNSHEALITKVPSDGSTASDVEMTPKKLRPLKFMDIDLPNSQEIKTSVSLCARSIVTESSSESDTENNLEDQCTPILFRKKKKPKLDVKVDLIKKFDVEALPSRVMTRVRKPTAKLRHQENKKTSENILKPKFLEEQECEIDKEIITENISRLKSKNGKSKSAKSNNDSNKSIKQVDIVKESVKMDRNSRKKVEEAGNEMLEKYPEKAIDSIKDEKGKRREPKSNQKEPTDPNNQSSIAIIDAKQSIYSAVESKVKTQSSNKSKESNTLQVVSVHDTIADDVKNGRISRKKIEGNDKVKDSSKGEKRKTGERKQSRQESIDSKNQSSFIIQNTNKSLECTVESQNVTHFSNKSNEIKPFDLTESPVETKRSVRSTRNKTTKTEKKSASPEQDSQTVKTTKRKYTRKKQPEYKIEINKEPSPETEVRRSKRQRTVKENKEEPEKVPKSILKKSLTVPHEESTVYNVSSGSNSDSSRSFKRPALDDSVEPSSKRTRSVVANNTSLRRTPARMAKVQYVLFTAFPFEAVKVKLEKLGAVVVTDVMKSTVILTSQIKRTFKLLCAVGLGRPIVGPSWVQACADTNMIVDPWLYLMKDEAAEKRFQFSLERTLTGKRNFLKGYNVSSTPSVKPEAHEMRLIVECSGGTWKEGGPQWICVSVLDDMALWPALRSRGATVVSTEFILGGVLRQKVDIDANNYK